MRAVIIYIFLQLHFLPLIAQQEAPINFHHLTVRNGLNDGIINAMVQDKYGYMWFASYGALNRFNGSSVERYTNVLHDSSTPPASIAHAMYCSEKGNLYIGYDAGLFEFDYPHNNFRRVAKLAKKRITAITSLASGELVLIADGKLVRFNPEKNDLTFIEPIDNISFFNDHPPSSLSVKNSQLYVGTKGGYSLYSVEQNTAYFEKVASLGETFANKVLVDNNGYVWMNNIFSFRLIRFHPVSKQEQLINNLPNITALRVQLSFLDFATEHDNVWIVTSLKGLIQFNIRDGSIRFHQQDNVLPGSIATNILRGIYIAPDANIWINLLGGVDYFNPSKRLFTIIYPLPGGEANTLARGFAEDHQGNYWFTTGDGISMYNKTTQRYKIWKNEMDKPKQLYYNSARAVLSGDDGMIWIATGKGVNQYNPATNHMEFLASKDGLPEGFYLNINKDSDGVTWFSTNSNDGLYYYSPADKKTRSIKEHPFLRSFAGYETRCVYEDSKKRLWLGFDGRGYAVYDRQAQSVMKGYTGQNSDSSFMSNLVVDIKEDRKGVIWMTTFNGLVGLDPATNKRFRFTTENGLRSNITSGLAVDKRNRLWISSSSGLMLLDSSRQHFSYFDESFGLPSPEFPEHQAHYMLSGDIVFPSNKGYIMFNPLRYEEELVDIRSYIRSFHVFDKPHGSYHMINEEKKIHLSAEENFFTIELEALNFISPGQTWYAYILDGLEKNWHYTQDPKAVYTNVPGDNYTFRYKATGNPNNWSVPEHILSIRVATKFYKTAWFWLIIATTLLFSLFRIYRYRMRKEKQLYVLESKAQLLEKEKAMVMYESLKQQLNPHFLFNSLTSLNSLIQTADKKTAGNFLDSLSKTYRYILKSRDTELVALGDEIRFAENYIQLQKTRFEKGFDVKIDIPVEYLHHKIVPVTLQNLLENAIKHNTIDEESPLIVSITVEAGILVVRNNLQKKKFVESSNRQGLGNLQSLYTYLSSQPVAIDEDAYKFTVKIPLL